MPWIDFRHLGGFHSLVPAIIVEDQKVFAGHDFVFIENLFRSGEIAFRIDVLDIEFPFGRVLIFRQHSLHVGGDRRCSATKKTVIRALPGMLWRKRFVLSESANFWSRERSQRR